MRIGIVGRGVDCSEEALSIVDSAETRESIILRHYGYVDIAI